MQCSYQNKISRYKSLNIHPDIFLRRLTFLVWVHKLRIYTVTHNSTIINEPFIDGSSVILILIFITTSRDGLYNKLIENA